MAPRALWLGMWTLLGSGCAPGCGEAPPEIDAQAIAAKTMSGDTLVTYRDGERVIGTLVDDGHRLPLAYDQLPLAWQVAVVAAEDSQFWHHSGVSLRGVARAARDNLWSGTVVSGGSTISQQTIKNLLDRRERTLSAKWRELDYTMHLEEAFSKADILTFYSNLFHVTGTGSGLGVAARYFFDSTPEPLSLVELAFIAGQIQAPAEFDPFEGSQAQQTARRKAAHARTTYVLRRIRAAAAGAVTPSSTPGRGPVEAIQDEAAQLLAEGFEIPFRHGAFRYAPHTVVDEVARRLDTPAFQQILTDAGLHPDEGGLTVVTTLDPDLQREATWALWHHLTELGLRLEQATVEALRVPEEALPTLPEPAAWTQHAFAVGRVHEHLPSGHLAVHVQQDSCTVDATALRRVGRALGVSNVSVSAALPAGTQVWVSQREPTHCDLEVVPELQGAAVALERGQLRALVGGNTNRDYDRTRAPRQFGSAFKPLVFHAAMSLGWRPDDLLANHVMPFTYSKTLYEPRQGHTAPAVVSMARAGASSENIAAVWQLVHLVDRLTYLELATLARQMGLARQLGETPEAYLQRLRQLGVRVRTADLGDIATRIAGADFAEVHPIRGQAVLRTVYDQATLDRLGTLLEPCEQQVLDLQAALERRERPHAPDLSVRVTPEGLDLACMVEWEAFEPVDDHIAFASPRAAPRAEPSRSSRRGRRSRRRARRMATRAPVPVAIAGPELPELDHVYIGGALRRGEILQLQGRKAQRLRELQRRAHELHAPDIVYRHGDFRTLVALRYVQQLASQYGVQTELKPVLSLPLGTSELTLQEMTALYAGLVSGRAEVSPHAPDVGPTQLIQEIRDRSGRVVYRAELAVTGVVDPTVGDMTADILHHVVERGTGGRARGAVRVKGQAVPLGGKTGTTNDYRNSAFVGFVPAPAERGYDPAAGHIVGVYVGYDDNREMKGRGLRVSGSVGALPPFRELAIAIQAHTPSVPPPSARPVGGTWPLQHSPRLSRRRVGTLDVLTVLPRS